MLSHLGETRLAEFVINHCEQCRHDRTPLFDQCGKLDWQLFQGSFAACQNGFFSAENCFVQNTSKKSVLIAVRQGDTFEKLAGAANLVRRGLYVPACPKLLVPRAVQEIFVGVARRLTSHCLTASRDLVQSEDVPDLLRHLQPRTGKLLRWQESRPSIGRAKQARQTQKRQAAPKNALSG
jgi:hypothetical protein